MHTKCEVYTGIQIVQSLPLAFYFIKASLPLTFNTKQRKEDNILVCKTSYLCRNFFAQRIPVQIQ